MACKLPLVAMTDGCMEAMLATHNAMKQTAENNFKAVAVRPQQLFAFFIEVLWCSDYTSCHHYCQDCMILHCSKNAMPEAPDLFLLIVLFAKHLLL